MSPVRSEVQSSSEVHSSYLVERLLGQERNLYSTVKFQTVATYVRPLVSTLKRRPRVLDLGCANRTAYRYLRALGCRMDYCGVDYEQRLGPDIVADIRDATLYERLPWKPDVILLLDVLEHLEGREGDIRRTLSHCRASLAPGGIVLAIVPQMYRLDRLKLGHLSYSEHKIRLTLSEWLSVMRTEFNSFETHGVGYLSTLPYAVMFCPSYRNDGLLERSFNVLRENVFGWRPLEPLEGMLTRYLGRIDALKPWANSCLIVCSNPAT